MLAKMKAAYRMGLLDGYRGDPPEQRFLNVERTEAEMERWHAGHSDGQAIRCLDEANDMTVGLESIELLQPHPEPDGYRVGDGGSIIPTSR